MKNNYHVLKSCKDCKYLVTQFDPDWYDFNCNQDDNFKNITKYIEKYESLISSYYGDIDFEEKDAESIELLSIIGKWQKDHRVDICGICENFEESKTKKKIEIIKKWHKFEE
jgi:hypothetical protein